MSWGLWGALPGGGTPLSSPTPLRIEGPQRHRGAVRSKSTPVTFGRGAASGRGHRDNVSMATKGLFNYSAAEARGESSLNSDPGNLFSELSSTALRTSLASYEDELCRGTAHQMAVRGSIRPAPCIPGSCCLIAAPVFCARLLRAVMNRMGCLLWGARESGKTANVSEQGLMKLKNHPDARGSSIYPSQQDSGSQQPRVLQTNTFLWFTTTPVNHCVSTKRLSKICRDNNVPGRDHIPSPRGSTAPYKPRGGGMVFSSQTWAAHSCAPSSPSVESSSSS